MPKREHNWIKTIPIFQSFASCSECGKVNNADIVGTNCIPTRKIKNKDKPAPDGFGGQPLI
jgi:transposase